MSINITLPPELGQFVEDQIRSGAFSNPSDVVGNALLTLKAQDMTQPEVTQELLDELATGISEYERGECVPWDVEELKNEFWKELADSKQFNHAAHHSNA